MQKRSFKHKSNNNAKWIKERERISKLKCEIESLGEFPAYYKDAFQYAIDFFNIISSFQDDGYIYNAPIKLEDAQNEFNKHIKDAGRNEFGFNRTKPGEKVTLENTYWGNIYGISTFSAAHLLYDYEHNPPLGVVISYMQIRPFIKLHMGRLLNLCNIFLSQN